MALDRRDFLRRSALAGAALGLGGGTSSLLGCAQPGDANQGQADQARSLQILILGGTGFIGIHEAEYAMSRGHEVTLFNRGLTNPNLFPGLEKLRGDRDGDLSALAGRRWDVVIDNSATVPRRIDDAAAILADATDRYVYVSSSGVYYPYLEAGLTEESQTQVLEDTTTEEVNGETFGGLKSLCEDAVHRAYGDRALVVRPVLISGPWDYTDRSTYWPSRLARGGEVLAPGDGTDPFQLIDARDLTGWMVRMAEAGEMGTYNAVGPQSPMTMRDALTEMAAVASSEVSLAWADTDFLLEQDVAPWGEMCCWIPPRGDYLGMTQIDGSKAWAKGLTVRSQLETAQDILAWLDEPGRRGESAATRFEMQPEPAAGLDADKEARVLGAWHARTA